MARKLLIKSIALTKTVLVKSKIHNITQISMTK